MHCLGHVDALGFARARGGAGGRDGAARGERRGAAADDHLGLHGGTAARVPDAAAFYVDDFCHALFTSPNVFLLRKIKDRAALRTRALAASSRYSTGDLPSMRASSSPGSRVAARSSNAAGASQVTRDRYGCTNASKQCKKPSRALGTQADFSSMWLRQNARSKAGSPY